ncbi:MAG TPA: hypothetical protein VIL86_20770 [Tepidisphaeraceae bacterium]|jgi:Trk-type K+ transport system membrane component
MADELSATLPIDPPFARRAGHDPLIALLIAGYLAIVLAAIAFFHFTGDTVHTADLGWDRATFITLNAATLTGFQQNTRVGDFLPAAQFMLFFLTLAGSLFSMVAGGVLVCRILRLEYSTGRIVLGAVILETIGMVVGGLALSPGQTLCSGIFNGAAALGNSGLHLGKSPDLSEAQLHAILLPLSILGGLGLPVVMELFDGLWSRRALSTHARTVLTLTCLLYLLTVAVWLLLGWPDSDAGVHPESDVVGVSVTDWPAVRKLAVAASTAAVNLRTPGFAASFSDQFPYPAMEWCGMLLMLIGAAPAGTGGGVKTTTIAQIVLGVRNALTGRPVGRAFGIAATWLGFYCLMVLVALLFLLNSEPDLPADRILFLTISAASNVGLSHNPLSIVKGGMYMLSTTMLLGRVAPVLVLWWMSRSTANAQLAVG